MSHHQSGKYSGDKGSFDKTLFKKSMAFAKPYWYLLLISLILMLTYTAADIYRPLLEGKGIDLYMKGAIDGKIDIEDALAGLYHILMVYGGLIIAQFVIGILRNYLMRYTSQRIIKNIRTAVFNKVQHLPISYFDKHPAGAIATRITNDPAALNELFTTVILGFMQSIVVMVFVLVTILNKNVSLTLCIMAVMPIVIVGSIYFQKMARKIFREVRTKIAKVNAFLSENISGIKIIKAFDIKKQKIDESRKINADLRKAEKKIVYLFGIFRPLMDFVRNLALALLLYYGASKFLAGTISIGLLYIFIKYMRMFFNPLVEFSEQFNIFQSSMAAAEKIFSILEDKEESDPINATQLSAPIKGKIVFKNVWFAYIDENWVLKDVSFTISAGQDIAIVGATGAGKTSIINLLCGFYEYQKGSITIDGIELHDMKKRDYRKHIGLVLQDVFLMTGTVKDNIRLSNKDISDEKVVKIARYVQADRFIEKLPKGYNEKIYSGGSTLSSGERQLISFARALLNDPEILIMDEATANIDTETESLIQTSLSKLQQNRTSITIAHRLSTIQKSDNIIVLHNGRIYEKGNHSELIQQQGLYYDLVKLQYSN
jgi:ATP-binding cassette subfamily B protein